MPRREGIAKQQSQAEAQPARGNGGGSAFADPRRDSIAEVAYCRAERRGFVPGSDMQDSLDAERELAGDEPRA